MKSFEVRIHDKYEQLKGFENQRLHAVEGLTESKQEEERIKTQLENLDERIKSISREVEESQLLEKIREGKIAKLDEKKANQKSELTKLKQQLEEVQDELIALGEAKEKAKEKILNKNGEAQALKERITLLKKFIESYEDHPEGVQHLLLHGHLNGGCKGTLAENLTVESTYRRAVETAIGEAAVSLIVDASDQALECIEVLKADEKGSVTFFPLDKFSAQNIKNDLRAQNDEILQAHGVLGWAHSLVQCKNEYRTIVQSLLRDFLIVEDLQTAKQQADKLRENRINLITLNGEVVSNWGPIKGGANGKSQAGVIGRKALVEELESKLKETWTQLEKEEKEQQEVESRHQKSFNKEQDLDKQVKAAEVKLTDLGIELAQLNFESRKDAEMRERLAKEGEAHEKNRKSLADKMQTVSPSLNNLLENKTQFEGALKQSSDELESLEQEIKEYRTVEQDSRVRLADLKSEERHLQNNIARLHEFDRELKGSFKRIDDEISAAVKEHEELEKNIEQNKGAIEADFDEHKILETEVHKLEQTFLENKEEVIKKEKFVKAVRDEKDVISETLHSMELRVTELKMNAEQIKERIKEEYGVTLKKGTLEEDFDDEGISERIHRQKDRLESMGPVNLLALKEYEKEKSRFDFLQTQKNDLIEAETNLNETIQVINKTAREQFSKTFEEIRENFIKVFQGFFENGQANLKLAPNADPLEAEIIIEAATKNKRATALTLLSGGEKALTAISILFAIYLVKPSPFCILDEVDAPLDDTNIGRFVKALRSFSEATQFLVVTHNKLTMRAADSLYGVTMEEEGVSKVVSVSFKDMDLKQPSKAA